MGEIRQAICRVPHTRVWRNNTGVLQDARGIPVRYGLAIGSSDLVGLCAGRFLAIEVKRPGGLLTEDQAVWLRTIVDLGGIAFLAYSAAGALRTLRADIARDGDAVVVGSPIAAAIDYLERVISAGDGPASP